MLAAVFLLGVGALLFSARRHTLAQQPTRTTLPDGSILIQTSRSDSDGISGTHYFDTFEFIPADSPQTVETVGSVESGTGLSLQYADLGRPVLFGQSGGPLVHVFVRSAPGAWRATELRAQNPTISTVDRSLRVWTWPGVDTTDWYHVTPTGAFERFRQLKGHQQ